MSVSTVRPSGLGDPDILARARDSNPVDLGLQEGSGVLRSSVPVEPGVDVDSSVVGGLAQNRVSNDGVKGIDGHNRSAESGSTQDLSCCVKLGHHRRCADLAVLDVLIPDRDSVDYGPIPIDRADQCCDCCVALEDVIDAENHFDAVGA